MNPPRSERFDNGGHGENTPAVRSITVLVTCAVLAVSVLSGAVLRADRVPLLGQTAIPTRGGGAGGGGQAARAGGPPQPANLPASPVAVPLPAISAQVTGPGEMF